MSSIFNPPSRLQSSHDWDRGWERQLSKLTPNSTHYKTRDWEICSTAIGDISDSVYSTEERRERITHLLGWAYESEPELTRRHPMGRRLERARINARMELRDEPRITI